jgi:hypothetical protein
VRRFLSPSWIAVHLLVVLAVLGMLRLGLWQWHRAHSPTGGIQNYAYAVQWPLFACFGIYLWFRTMQEERRGDTGTRGRLSQRIEVDADIEHHEGLVVGLRTEVPVDDGDVELAAWNARFAALRAATASADERGR